MEVIIDILGSILPQIAIKVARILAEKLAEVGGISPKEAAVISVLDALEGLINAATREEG